MPICKFDSIQHITLKTFRAKIKTHTTYYILYILTTFPTCPLPRVKNFLSNVMYRMFFLRCAGPNVGRLKLSSIASSNACGVHIVLLTFAGWLMPRFLGHTNILSASPGNRANHQARASLRSDLLDSPSQGLSRSSPFCTTLKAKKADRRSA